MGIQTEERNKIHKRKPATVYRLELVENSTHRPIYSIGLTKRKFILYATTCAVVTVVGLWCLIALTPLRTSIPGYPNAHSKREAVSNAIKIDSLESSIRRWEFYAENLSRVLTGEETVSMDSLVKNGVKKYLSNKAKEELIRQDSVLRDKVLKEEQFGISDGRQRRMPLEGMHFFCPLKGVISNGYDIAMHPAVDITAPAKSVVSSVLGGTVISAGWDEASGYTIHIQHPGDIISIYKHNEKLLKKVGDKVSAGTPVALVGNTGSLTTGDHLHFELWHDGESVDPTKYISF